MLTVTLKSRCRDCLPAGLPVKSDPGDAAHLRLPRHLAFAQRTAHYPVHPSLFYALLRWQFQQAPVLVMPLCRPEGVLGNRAESFPGLIVRNRQKAGV
jgi:hypothetical protein